MIRLALAFLLLALPAFGQERIVAGLSQNQVQITATFDGSAILIYGAIKRDAPDPGGPPLAVIVNRSVADLGAQDPGPDLEALAARLSPPARDALATILVDLRARARREQELRAKLGGPILALEDLLVGGPITPREVVRALAAHLGGAP